MRKCNKCGLNESDYISDLTEENGISINNYMCLNCGYIQYLGDLICSNCNKDMDLKGYLAILKDGITFVPDSKLIDLNYKKVNDKIISIIALFSCEKCNLYKCINIEEIL